MAYVLCWIGGLVAIGGGWWVYTALQGYPGYGGSDMAGLAVAMAAAPGFGAIVTGVIMIGAGEALFRLADLVRTSHKTELALSRLAEDVTRQTGR